MEHGTATDASSNLGSGLALISTLVTSVHARAHRAYTQLLPERQDGTFTPLTRMANSNESRQYFIAGAVGLSILSLVLVFSKLPSTPRTRLLGNTLGEANAFDTGTELSPTTPLFNISNFSAPSSTVVSVSQRVDVSKCTSRCGFELLQGKSAPDAAGPVPFGCSDASWTSSTLLKNWYAIDRHDSKEGKLPLWISFIGDSILRAEFKELVTVLLGKSNPESPTRGGTAPAGSLAARSKVDLARFTDDRHNCEKGGDTKACFISGSKEMYYYVPRVICCSSDGSSKAPVCALYRLMPQNWEQVAILVSDHTQGTTKAKQDQQHVCVSFIFMRTPADVISTSTPLLLASKPPVSAVVINPALHPMAPVLHYTPEFFALEVGSMYTWLAEQQTKQAAKAAASGSNARTTLFFHQLATPVLDAKVNPRHTAFMSTQRVDAYNAGIRASWKDYAATVAGAGAVPARLINAHHTGARLTKTVGPVITHDGVHLRHEFSQMEARIVVNAVLSAAAAQATPAGC